MNRSSLRGEGFPRDLVSINEPLSTLFHKEEHVAALHSLLCSTHGKRYREEVRDHGTFPTGIALYLVIGLYPFVDDSRLGKVPPPAMQASRPSKRPGAVGTMAIAPGRCTAGTVLHATLRSSIGS